VLNRLPWVLEQIKSLCNSPRSTAGSSPSPQGGEGAGGEVPLPGSSPSPQGGEGDGIEVAS
jgi:hypothetical protein